MNRKEEICRVVAKALNVSPESVTPDSSTGSFPAWDSMGQMTVITALEEAFDVEFPIEDLFDLVSIEAFDKEITKLKD